MAEMAKKLFHSVRVDVITGTFLAALSTAGMRLVMVSARTCLVFLQIMALLLYDENRRLELAFFLRLDPHPHLPLPPSTCH